MKKLTIIIAVLIFLILSLLPFLPLSSSVDSKIESKIDLKVSAQLEKEENVSVLIFMKEGSQIKTKGSGSDKVKLSAAISALSDKGFELKSKSHYFPLVSGKITKKAFERLKDDPNIESIMLEPEMKIFLPQTTVLINATKTWNLQVSGTNLTGAGETVCVIDTGVNYSNINLGGCFGTGCRVVDGYNFLNDNSDPMDDGGQEPLGHGTFVAGIIAANGEITGVAPDAKIVALKACSNADGLCNAIAIQDSIKWCVDNSDVYNISVISMSLGGGLYTNYCDSSSIYTSLINNATAKNITVVAATGNGASTTAIADPACIQNVTSVGMTYKSNGGSCDWTTCTDSSTAIDQVVCLSNRNNITDLFAPGALYIQSLPLSGTCCLSSKGGTSYATPHVSAAVAILQQYSRLQRNKDYSVVEINAILKDNGKQIYDNATGLNFSRIDIYNSIDSTSAPATSLVSPLNNTVSLPSAAFSCNATDNVGVANITLYVWNSTGICNSTTNSVSGAFNQTQFNITMEEGNYIWSCLAADASGNTGWAENFTLTIDPVPQYYNLTEPTDPSTYSAAAFYQFNATWQDNIALSSVWFEFNGTNYTAGNVSDNYYYNLTDIAAGNYSYRWWANDTAGNINSTDLFSFTISKADPELNLTFILDSLIYDSNIIIENGTSVNRSVASLSAEINISLYENNTLIANLTAPFSNVTVYGAAGTFNLTAVQPESQNFTSGSETHSIEVENWTTAPRVEKIYPENNAYLNNNTINFNISAKDASLKNSTLYIWNTTLVLAIYSSNLTGMFNSTNFTFDFSNYSNMAYKWSASACDNRSNCGTLVDDFIITIDTIIPDIDLDIEYDSIYTDGETEISCSSSDINLNTIKIYVDDDLKKSCSSSSCSYTYSSSSTGEKAVNCTVTDKASNTNSDTGTITVKKRSGGGGGGGGTSSTTATAAEEAEETAETINVLFAQTPFAETLENKTRLKEAIEKMLETALSEQAIKNLEALSASISQDTTINREITIESNKSTLDLKIKYNGTAKATNFMIYDKIPKSFAQNADSVTVSAPGAEIEVVEQDPEYLFLYPEIIPQQEISISYIVNKKVNESVIDEISTSLFAEKLVPEKKGMPLGTFILIMLLTILVIIAIIALRVLSLRKKMNEGRIPFVFKPKKQPLYSMVFP